MSDSIPQVYIETFERLLLHVAQQQVNRLRPHVHERSVNSAAHNWEVIGSTDASEKTTRAQPTPIADIPFSRRVSQAKTFDVGELTEQEDLKQVLVDLNGNMVMSLGYALRRAQDDEIVRSFGADALDGEGALVPFDAGQVVGDYSSKISFDLITRVQEEFLENDITPDMPKCMVVGPRQVSQLMRLTEQTSADYVAREALQRLTSTGIVANWMGMTWVMSTRLLAPMVDQLDCYAFTPRAIGLQLNSEISVDVAKDPGRSFAWSIYAHSIYGSVRVLDTDIVQLQVEDAA